MKAVFFQILDMSISASYLVLAVVLLRLVLKKAPKAIHCILWGMVALRLLCPALPESQASLIPNSQPVTSVVMPEAQPSPGVSVVQPVLPSVNVPQPSVPQQTEPEKMGWEDILPVAWLVGVAAMVGYGGVSYVILRRKVAPAILEDGVWLCDHVASPFILGIFRPRIYLPSSLSESCRESVLAHERAHLRRKDHWWKPLGFCLLAVHWFNPAMWLAYILLCRDIEAACDERVVKKMDPQARKAYSEALLQCAAPRRSIAACPLAFGEQGVKGRIKSVLSYKKPTVWIILVAIVASAVLAVCFLTNPNNDSAKIEEEKAKKTQELRNLVPEYFALGHDGAEIYVWVEDREFLCGALPITSRPKEDEEIEALTGITLEEMALVLDTYSVPDWHVVVQPYGLSQFWTEEQSHNNTKWLWLQKYLRANLGLYVQGQDETIGVFTIASEDDIQPVFGDGFFYAEGNDGLYKVYYSDIDSMRQGKRLSISYVNKMEMEDGQGFEITAKMIYVLQLKQDPGLQDNLVYFDLFDGFTDNGLLHTQTLTRYVVTVTDEEKKMLEAIPASKKWSDPLSLDGLDWYDGYLTMMVSGTYTKQTLYHGGLLQSEGLARLNGEEKALIEHLKKRAKMVEYSDEYSLGYYSARPFLSAEAPHIQLQGDVAYIGSSMYSSYLLAGNVTRENGRITITTDEAKPQVFVFDTLRHMLIYNEKLSQQSFLELQDGTVFSRNIG